MGRHADALQRALDWFRVGFAASHPNHEKVPDVWRGGSRRLSLSCPRPPRRTAARCFGKGGKARLTGSVVMR